MATMTGTSQSSSLRNGTSRRNGPQALKWNPGRGLKKSPPRRVLPARPERAEVVLRWIVGKGTGRQRENTSCFLDAVETCMQTSQMIVSAGWLIMIFFINHARRSQDAIILHCGKLSLASIGLA
jgi:hypothetical protein